MTASHPLFTIAALAAALAAAMRTIGAGIDQALAMLPGRQLLRKLLSQPLLLPSLMAPSSAPLPFSSQPFSSCYLQMCSQCVRCARVRAPALTARPRFEPWAC